MLALSSSGVRLWEQEAALWSTDKAWTGEQLILAGANGAIWSMGARASVEWGVRAGGKLALSDDRLLSYDNQGIHRLDVGSRSSEMIYALPRGLPGHVDLVVLPDGTALATHRDMSGSSLIALKPDGTLRWRHSYPITFREQRELLAMGDHAYLITQIYGLSDSTFLIHQVDLEKAELIPLFRSGSRDPNPKNTWFAPLDQERLLIHINGTGLLALDLQAAREETLRP
jgi:hypothetical protein